MLNNLTRIIALGGALAAAPVQAEVTRTTDNGFTTRDEAVVEATPKAVWLSLISPADWWNSDHTWSGDAGNLTLMPQAGGCFCEKIPEVDEPDRFTLEGSVEHMQVIQAYPESALRMRGALGPLQSEPVTGILTIAISEVDEGTRIVWEYNVGGEMRYEVAEIAKAVDGVMSQQLAGLADKLGRISGPETDPAPQEEEGDAEAAEGETPSDEEEETKPSVEDAFGDLSQEAELE